MKSLPGFLQPETTIREAGKSDPYEIGSAHGESVLLTLGITRILEQESLDISIWASPDGADWGARPLVSFPQKFYCGTYQLLVDLAERSEVKYLQVRWQAQRWGKGELKPLFAFYVFAQELEARVSAALGA
ncbi:MAG: hypothetical protein FJW37_09975 [Acidobacteria bacterium]|nr:hypothetical protein [Acidobacteriota bacterium]